MLTSSLGYATAAVAAPSADYRAKPPTPPPVAAIASGTLVALGAAGALLAYRLVLRPRWAAAKAAAEDAAREAERTAPPPPPPPPPVYWGTNLVPPPEPEQQRRAHRKGLAHVAPVGH